jgi:hypothetical protein
LLSGSLPRRGFARRYDGGPQECDDPTFINALVNGKVAPQPAVHEALSGMPVI